MNNNDELAPLMTLAEFRETNRGAAGMVLTEAESNQRHEAIAAYFDAFIYQPGESYSARLDKATEYGNYQIARQRGWAHYTDPRRVRSLQPAMRAVLERKQAAHRDACDEIRSRGFAPVDCAFCGVGPFILVPERIFPDICIDCAGYLMRTVAKTVAS